MNAKERFLENYKHWMRENGLNQRKLGSLTDQPDSLGGYISTGSVPPSLAYLSKLKILFRDFDYSELLEEPKGRKIRPRGNMGGARILASLPNLNAIKLVPGQQVCKIIIFTQTTLLRRLP